MNKNPIEISKSSLLSLKAEILRKQQEVKNAKLQAKSQNSIPKSKPKIVKNSGVDERRARDIEPVDEDQLKKSRTALEAKARLYDKLSKGVDIRDDDQNAGLYLVQFDRKIQDKKINEEDTEDKYPAIDDDDDEFGKDYPSTDPEDDWVDYVDCLGRTRKCLRKDLPFLKSRDAELSANLPPEKKTKRDDTSPQWSLDTRAQRIDYDTIDISEQNELLSSDMRRELLRQQWEKEEEELRDKTDIHYQDVLFNEARSHGVGYFGFSHDEQERAKQQDDLKKLRNETITKQVRVREQREMRDKLMQARVKAARNRKRERMGLPPEEDEPETKVVEPSEEELEETKLKAAEEAEKLEEEKKKQKARSKQIRPWDIGKQGVREVKSQEEWNEEKRDERPEEFAPPSFYRSNIRFTDDQNISDEKHSLFFTTKSKKRKHEWKNYSDTKNVQDKPLNIDTSKPPPVLPPYSLATNASQANSEVGNEQSDLYDPFEEEIIDTAFRPTPLINECSDIDDTSSRSSQMTNSERRGVGTEIPPPPTFEYYGPSSSHSKKVVPPINELRSSIEAGLKFLRKQSEKKHAQTENVGFFD